MPQIGVDHARSGRSQFERAGPGRPCPPSNISVGRSTRGTAASRSAFRCRTPGSRSALHRRGRDRWSIDGRYSSTFRASRQANPSWPGRTRYTRTARCVPTQDRLAAPGVHTANPRYRWYIAPSGAGDEVVDDVANDFNSPIEGQDPKPVSRRRDRFSHDRHLFHALLMLTWGSMFFEQLYRFDETANRFRLRELAPRMPGSIPEIQVHQRV